MQNSLDWPKRTIHLDFHTGPQIPDVGKDFDPETFARTFKDAHVDSVTVFAMCHHGHLYYDSDHPARHPGMAPGLRLLERQIEALHREGIRAPIYLSVQCNEFAANEHPDWVALTSELKQVKWGGSAYEAGWKIMDMSSPYQDYLADIVAEVLERFAPVDGIFLDMCWDQQSASKWAIEGMVKKGYDPRKPEDRSRYARETAHAYMSRYRGMVEEAQRKHKPAGIWFNSRPKTNLHEEKSFIRHVEIEALPTGGWGYAYFSYVSRFVRPLGLPTLSHTGRFFKGWGDNMGLKPEAALKYECCQILSQGLTNGVGDLLHPRGVPSPAVYDRIGRVYDHIRRCEPYVEGGKLVSQIAVIVDPALGDNPGPSGMGAVRALTQLRHQFDLVPPSADLTGYELVLIPETTRIDAELRGRLRIHAAQGGSLIVIGRAALDDAGAPVMEELGIKTHGDSPYSHITLHADDSVSTDLADYGYVMYEKGYRMTPLEGAESLVTVGEPYFERKYDRFSGHEYTPFDQLSPYAAAVRHKNAITFAVPLLEAYGKHAAPNYRILLGNCIRLLIPRPLIRDDGPSGLETTVVRMDDALVVHLLSFNAARRAEGLDIVEDAIPLVNMTIEVRADQEPREVLLAPDDDRLEYTYADGYVHTSVSTQEGHVMLVIRF